MKEEIITAILCTVMGLSGGLWMATAVWKKEAIEAGAACYQHAPDQRKGKFDWNCDGVSDEQK